MPENIAFCPCFAHNYCTIREYIIIKRRFNWVQIYCLFTIRAGTEYFLLDVKSMAYGVYLVDIFYFCAI